MKRIDKKWFTLVEMLITFSIIIIVLPVIWQLLVELQQKNYFTKLKSDTLSDLTIINSSISSLIKNSYGVSYSDTNKSGDLDKLVLFSDKLERNKITLSIVKDVDYDLSRIYIQLWDKTPVPLHSSRLYIEKFDIDFTNKPTNTVTADIQPWVSFNIKARSRSPLEKPTDDDYYNMYNKTETSLLWRVLIRNYVPSSIK